MSLCFPAGPSRSYLGPFEAHRDNKQCTSDKILTRFGSEFGRLFASELHKLTSRGTSPADSEKSTCGKIRAGILNIAFTGGRRKSFSKPFALSGMAWSVGKLNNFVALDEKFGYVQNVETAHQVLREFETLTTTSFCSFYSKDFVKLYVHIKHKPNTNHPNKFTCNAAP